MLLVNDSLKFYIEWYANMLKFFAVQKLPKFFQQKISEYCVLNPLKQLMKWPLRRLWTTGPRWWWVGLKPVLLMWNLTFESDAVLQKYYYRYPGNASIKKHWLPEAQKEGEMINKQWDNKCNIMKIMMHEQSRTTIEWSVKKTTGKD